MSRKPDQPSALGHVTTQRDGERWTLVFVRELPHAPEKVWCALTDPRELREWAPFDADRDLAQPGPATLTMAGGDGSEKSKVTVRRADAPRLLEYTWDQDVLRWELDRNSTAGNRSTPDTRRGSKARSRRRSRRSGRASALAGDDDGDVARLLRTVAQPAPIIAAQRDPLEAKAARGGNGYGRGVGGAAAETSRVVAAPAVRRSVGGQAAGHLAPGHDEREWLAGQDSARDLGVDGRLARAVPKLTDDGERVAEVVAAGPSSRWR